LRIQTAKARLKPALTRISDQTGLRFSSPKPRNSL